MVNDSSIGSSKLDASEKSEECTDVIEDTTSDALRSEQSENRVLSNDLDISGQVFPCSLCGKTFDKASSLKQHSHVHTRSTSKSVTCVLCLRRYTQYPNLCRHWRHDHRAEHEILRKINVTIPRTVGGMSRAVRDDRTNSNLRPNEPGLIGNWSFPVPSPASDQQRLATPFPMHGADVFLRNKVSCSAPLTGTRISTTAFTGTKIPPVSHPGVMMFPNATFTGYPAFPGLMGGASMMPRQSPYVFPGHALHPQLNGHLNHTPPIGQWFGYPTPFPPTFPLLGLLPPTNLLDSHAAPWWWSAPLIQIPPVLSSTAKQKEVTSPEVDQTTTVTSRPSSSFHQKRKREETPEADILNASKIRETAVKRSYLQNDRHHTKRSKVKLEPTITEESNIPGKVEASPDSSTAPKKEDHLEQPTPSETPGGTDGNRLTVHTLLD